MGLDLYRTYPEATKIFDRADQVLGFPLSRTCFEGPEDKLNEDLTAQLAVYTLSCAVTDILKTSDITPTVTTGYSSGFYAAAYAAGCFDFTEGLDLVRRAGEILLDEGGKIDGSMAVIFGLSLEQIEQICRQTGNVQVAIRNTPRQTVISGIESSVRRVMEASLAEGALDTYPLSVATAYHSKLMEQSTVRFLRELEDAHLQEPQAPLFSYSSLEKVLDANTLKQTMASQLSNPVFWVDLIKKIRNEGNTLFVEVGPGAVLYRTVRWIDRNIEIMITARHDSLVKVMERCNALTEA
jgi:[acyl-carrier-protein] S-malonyltransferase